MSAEKQDGRATEVTPPVAAGERASAPPSASTEDSRFRTFPRPRGATPLFTTVEVIDARDLMTESADMGDALALDNAVVSYRFRWYWSLGGDAA